MKKKCYFCGTDKNLTEHHIIFQEFLKGGTLKKNKEHLCEKCHKRFHKLAKPMIDLLLAVIKKFKAELDKSNIQEETREIGFVRTNSKKRGEKK